MFKSKQVLFVCTAIFIVLCLSILCFATSVFKVPDKFALEKDGSRQNAVFGRDGNIYLFDAKSNKITTIATSGKYSPRLSNDETMILYRKSVYETDDFSLIFGVIDISGQNVCEITVNTYLSNDIIDIEWITDNLVGITTHVNPSTSEYFIYDVLSGKLVERFVGSSFCVIPGTEKVIYEKNVPHWSDEPINHSYMIENKTVYTSDTVNANLGAVVFSDDMREIAFVETFSNEYYLVICDFDYHALSLTPKNKIKISSEVSGHLSFSDNKICFVNYNVAYWYNESSNMFVEETIETNLRNAATDLERMKGLQQAVIELWNDGSLNSVYDITWFSE